MDAAPVIDIRAGVDWIVLRVRSEVIVLVIGGRHNTLTAAGGRRRPPRLIIINNRPELILRRLVVSLLWIGRRPGWSVFTSFINIGRPRPSGRLFILREGWRTVVILSGGWRSGGFIVNIGGFGSIVIIIGGWRSRRFIVNIRSMIKIIGGWRPGRFIVNIGSVIIIIGGLWSWRTFIVNIGGFGSIIVGGRRSVWRIIRRFEWRFVVVRSWWRFIIMMRSVSRFLIFVTRTTVRFLFIVDLDNILDRRSVVVAHRFRLDDILDTAGIGRDSDPGNSDPRVPRGRPADDRSLVLVVLVGEATLSKYVGHVKPSLGVRSLVPVGSSVRGALGPSHSSSGQPPPSPHLEGLVKPSCL